jgi:hypothetical protein
MFDDLKIKIEILIEEEKKNCLIDISIVWVNNKFLSPKYTVKKKN